MDQSARPWPMLPERGRSAVHAWSVAVLHRIMCDSWKSDSGSGHCVPPQSIHTKHMFINAQEQLPPLCYWQYLVSMMW